MINHKHIAQAFLAVFGVVFLVACGPDNSGTVVAPPPAFKTLTAVDDSAKVSLGSTGTTIAVLVNDLLGEEPTTVTSVDQGSESSDGVATIATDGLSITYDAPSVGGSDTFTYTITDSEGQTSTATVTITLAVSPFAEDDVVSVDENAAINILVLENDSTADAPLMVNGIGTAADATNGVDPQNGTAVVNDNGTAGDSSDDFVVYTPNADFDGSDTFTYTIEDSTGKTALGTVSVTVLDVPKAADDTLELFKGGRGAPFVIADLVTTLSANDDADLTLVSFDYSGLSIEPTIEDKGTADESDDVIRYTAPSDDTVDSEAFTYTVANSAGREVTATVTINLDVPGACDADIQKRKDSGLGWCLETHFDSFDTGADTDGTGTNIALTVFFPHPWHQRLNAIASGAVLGADESGYSPLLIHSHGFGGSKQEDFQDPETFLDNQVAKAAWLDGYNVISYTQRGFGGSQQSGTVDDEVSGDSIRVLDPDFEGLDFIRVVDWAICHLRADAPLEAATDAENFEVDANNCATDFNGTDNWGASLLSTDDGIRLDDYDDDVAIATVGYSYGGGFQFLAQSMDTRVDAIMPMGTWHDLRFSLHPNDTPKFTWIEIMNQFAGTAPGLGGGNGEALPPLLTEARTESNGANAEPDDSPHNKDHQVSVKNARILGSKGPSAWCNGAQDYYGEKYGDLDGDPEDLAAGDPGPANGPNEFDLPPKPENNPAHFTVTKRAARANLFMIQGYGDTLFNYNEGYDNARCFEDAKNAGVETVTDVRMLQQTSGHPFPTVPGVIPEGAIPPQYAGQDTAMYLDEVVHCGVDDDGNPVRYNMVEVLHQWMDFHLRGGLLPTGAASSADIFPNVCITQTNVDPDLTLSESDPFYNGSNADTTGFKWSREGTVFDSVADSPLGHSHFQNSDGTPKANLTLPEVTVNTGAAPASSPTNTLAPLYIASDPEGEVLSGIPLVHLDVARANPAVDDIVYAGVYVKRCQLDPKDTTFDVDGNPDNCDTGNTEELLHFQMAPVRVFPSAAAGGFPPPNEQSFPKENPRMFPGSATLGSYYPFVAGYNPPTMRGTGVDVTNGSSLADPQGRLLGVSTRLYPGDEVGLAFSAGHYAFISMAAATASQVTINGSVQLPLVNTSAKTVVPSNIPSYVENSAP